MLARLAAQAGGVGNKRLEQPHERAPLLDGAAEIVHGVPARALGIDDSRARAGKDIARNGTHRRPDRSLGLQGGFVAHFRF